MAAALTFARLSLASLLVVGSGLGAAGCLSEGEESHEEGDGAGDEWNEAYSYEQELRDGSCSGVRVPDQNGFDKKVALTFDDGPNLETTPKVLDVLKARGIRATFLINGNRVTSDAHRALLRRMLDEGHIVGNHTHTHQNATKLTATEFESQVARTDAVIRQLDIVPQYFRFPFGASTCATAQKVRSMGYVITGWHVDTADWCFASGNGRCPASTFQHVPDEYRNDMAALTIAQVNRWNGGIVLFHDIHANTANSLDGIVQRMLDAGYTFTNVDDQETFPKLNGTVEPPAPFIGTACQADEACTFEGGYCLRGTTTDGVCSESCEGYCPDETGHAPTFCAELNPSLGACLPKADAMNDDCKALAGTEARSLPRFIGSSSAGAATATVCVPQ